MEWKKWKARVKGWWSERNGTYRVTIEGGEKERERPSSFRIKTIKPNDKQIGSGRDWTSYTLASVPSVAKECDSFLLTSFFSIWKLPLDHGQLSAPFSQTISDSYIFLSPPPRPLPHSSLSEKKEIFFWQISKEIKKTFFSNLF